ncbi:MAG: hypothetical protein KC503_44835 [Myxococcales bacterium]|nr:hypothetical protein [Myxococcales bacterium]
MLISELNQEERYALLGLLKLIVRADHQLSSGETDQLRRIAKLMGEELFLDTTRAAHEMFKKTSDIKRYSEKITRHEARALLYDLSREAAEVGGISPEEGHELNWLAKLWDLEIGNDYKRVTAAGD